MYTWTEECVNTCPQPFVSRLVFTGSVPILHTNLWFQNIWSRHLVKQLWPLDGCRRTDGQLLTTFEGKRCVLATLQERSLKWIDPTEPWWREEWWTSRDASYRYLGVTNPGLQMLGSKECDVFYQHGTQASFQYIRRIPALYFFRPKKKQLEFCQRSSQDEWMDECAARLQPLVNQFKPRQKFRDLIVKTRSCPGDKKKSLL